MAASFSLHSYLHTIFMCVYDSLVQIDACSENISRKTAQVEEHSKAEAEAKVGRDSECYNPN